ncbi:MAG: DUF748 domain-containing protein [Rugosibacter sp.]|nr:DUF748 domain-containing protein [Rugosibacter sp.]
MTNPDPIRSSRWPRRLAITSGALTLLIALFGLLGYFWLPGFAKNQLETLLSEKLHRSVTIGAIHVKPYTLEATVEDFKVGDVLRFKSLYVDVSAATFSRRLPVANEVRLTAPELHLTRVGSDRLNVSDLLDEWLNKPDDGKPVPAFSINNIRLEGGRIVWQDNIEKHTGTLSEINLSLPTIANIPAEVDVFVHPAFAARLNGSPLKLAGDLRPFAASRDGQLQIDLENFDLTAALPYLRPYVQLPLDIDNLLLSTRLDVKFAKVGAGETALGMDGDVTFHQFKASLFDKHVRADIDAVRLQKISVDVLKRQASIGEIAINRPVLSLLREGTDSFAFAKPPSGTKPTPAAKPAQTTPAKTARPWQWSVGQITLNDGQVNYRDTTVVKSLPITISPLTLTAGPISSDAVHPVSVQIKGDLNQKGYLNIAGEVTQTGQADLALDVGQLDLVALQGWASDMLPVLLTRGDLDFKGRLQWRDGEGKVKGNLAVNRINLLDKHTSEDLLRWQSLSFSGLEVDTPTNTRPLAANLGAIDLKNFYAKVLLTKEGQLNLNQLSTTKTAATPAKNKTTETPAAATKPAPPAKTTAATQPTSNIRIGRITFANGAVDFTDHFIQPNYATQITQLSGHVDPIKAGTLSPVELHGKVERTAPLDITGQIDPLSKPIDLTIHATARGIDLSPLSSYSGRYVGYKIEKGKLSVEVDYKIKQGQLQATNHIFLDQLTFGEKVESKDALSIPVNLAVALLRNSRGEIDINLPISGSLNDPQFSIGGIIWQVLGNLLTKAVTSPFALLGSLFGGGEDLSEISFPAGQALITPEMTSRLETLAKALAERPGLKLEITGTADAATDKAGFSQTLLDRKMRSLKQAELAGKGQSVGSLEDVSLTPEETARYLAKVYKQEDIKDKPRNLVGLSKTLPDEEMKALLLTHFLPKESDLLALADARAQQVQSWLAEQGKVDPGRIFLRSAKIVSSNGNQTAGDQPAAAKPPVQEAVSQGGKVLFSLR